MEVRITFWWDDDDQRLAAQNACDVVTENLALTNGNCLFRSLSDEDTHTCEFVFEVETAEDADIVASVLMSFLPFMVDNVRVHPAGE